MFDNSVGLTMTPVLFDQLNLFDFSSTFYKEILSLTQLHQNQNDDDNIDPACPVLTVQGHQDTRGIDRRSNIDQFVPSQDRDDQSARLIQKGMQSL